jgi:hypothetical protein
LLGDSFTKEKYKHRLSLKKKEKKRKNQSKCKVTRELILNIKNKKITKITKTIVRITKNID